MRRRILLIDDDIASVSAARRALQAAGLEPLLATNPADAEVAVEHDAPEVILLSLDTGGGAGLALCRSLRSLAPDPLMPIILLGGEAEGPVKDIASALAAGADGFFPRPIDWGRVLRKIRIFLGDPAPTPRVRLPEPPAAVDTPEPPSEASAPEAPAGPAAAPPPKSEAELAALLEAGLPDEPPAGAEPVTLGAASSPEDPDAAWGGRTLDATWTEAAPHPAPAGRLGPGWQAGGPPRIELDPQREPNLRASRLPEPPPQPEPPAPEPEAAPDRDAEPELAFGAEADAAPFEPGPWELLEAGPAPVAPPPPVAEAPGLGPELMDDLEAPYAPPLLSPGPAPARPPPEAPAPPAAFERPLPPAAAEPPRPVLAPPPPPEPEPEPAPEPEPEPEGPPPAPQPTEAPFPVDGDLADRDVPHLLAALFRARATGALEVAGRAARRTVFVELGRLVGVRTDVADEQLGEVAHRRGLVTRDQVRQLRTLGPLTARQQAVALAEAGHLKAHEIYGLVRAQAEAALFGAFAVEDGRWRWRPELCPEDERVAHPEPPLALIVEGIRRKYLLPRIHRRLGGPSTVLAPAGGGAELLALGLPARERRLAEQVDGLKTAEELVFLSGLGEERTWQVLYALVATGAAALRLKGPLVETAATDPERREVERRIDRERIDEKYRQAVESDYFEILGVSREATVYELRAAYERLVRDYHPGRFTDPAFRDHWGRLEEIRRALDDAWDVLRDEGLRADYRAALERRPPG